MTKVIIKEDNTKGKHLHNFDNGVFLVEGFDGDKIAVKCRATESVLFIDSEGHVTYANKNYKVKVIKEIDTLEVK